MTIKLIFRAGKKNEGIKYFLLSKANKMSPDIANSFNFVFQTHIITEKALERNYGASFHYLDPQMDFVLNLRKLCFKDQTKI